jgi:hypothetical protein
VQIKYYSIWKSGHANRFVHAVQGRFGNETAHQAGTAKKLKFGILLAVQHSIVCLISSDEENKNADL